MSVSWRKIHSYFLIILLLLNTSVMWKAIEPFNLPDAIFKAIFLIWCSLGIFSGNGKFKYNKAWVNTVVCIVLYMAIYIVGSAYNYFSTFLNIMLSSIVLFTYCYTLLCNNEFEILCDAYINLLCIIAFITLFFWLFGSLLDILPGKIDIVYYWAEKYHLSKTYFYLYFENIDQNDQILLGLSIPRNCGIYTEAPGFSGSLLYAFGAEWFLKKNPDRKKLIILLATLLSTQSTKALVIVIVVFVVKYMIDNREVKSGAILVMKIFLSGILVAVSLYALYIIMQDKSSTGSFRIRIDDMHATIKTWKTHPLFGVGIYNTDPIIENFQYKRNNNGLSMGFNVLLAEGGIWLTSYYIFSLFMALKNQIIKSNKIPFYLFSLLIAMNLFISNVAFGMMMLLVINAGYAACAYRRDARKTKTSRA